MAIIGIIISVVLIVLCGGLYVYYHPQIIVGAIQKRLYQGKPINSYEPFGEPLRWVKEDGSLYVTEIAYDSEYPNSYLDITYQTADVTVERPTVIYFHGGGYFGGDKAMGDPLAVNDNANCLFEEIVANGYNFVNVNYALVPDYRFPVPLIQMNRAISFLNAHAGEYGLNMKNVVIFGQSAGAVLTAQYGALLASPKYRQRMKLDPGIQIEQIKALVIDDAPLVFDSFNLNLRLLMGNYYGTMNMQSETVRAQNITCYINSMFVPCFLTAGNTDGFPEDMQLFADKLEQNGVEFEYFFTERAVCELPHGYLNLVKENKNARECFDHILAFMMRYTK